MLLDLIKTRQSCRNYDPTRKVEKEKIDYLLNCAFLAPSARNRQPWHYVVVHNDEEKVNAIRKACQPIEGANAFLKDVNCYLILFERDQMVLSRKDTRIKTQDFRPFDIGTTFGYVSLATQEQGLAMCCIGMFVEEDIQQALQINDEVRMVLALGYAMPDDPYREKSRRDTVETTEVF